jgi:hypothetical protein
MSALRRIASTIGTSAVGFLFGAKHIRNFNHCGCDVEEYTPQYTER